MTSVHQAAIATSVLIGLVSIPAASESVNLSSGELANVSFSNEIPKQVVTEVDEDGLNREVKTAFDRFVTNITHGSFNASLETPRSRLEVERAPGRNKWVLTTSRGTLTVLETSEETVETTETSEGTLTKKVVDGETEVSFTGTGRDEVESTHHELKQMLHRKKQELENRRSRIKQRALPDVEVVVNDSTASGFGDSDSEKVILVNKGLEPVDLEGWELEDESSATYEFGSVEIPSRGRIHVYSRSPSSPETPNVMETGISWNDDGDTATIYNEAGTELDREDY